MLFLTLIVFCAPLFVASMDPPVQVPISVYYETLCPDSIKFITSQLYPTFTSSLKPRLSITLVPFGKAVKNSSPSGDEFECRHGPVECYGDMVQACAIKQLAHDQPKLLSLVNCLMGTADKVSAYPVDFCAEKTGVLPADIVNCANGTEGATLLATAAHLTASLQPPLRSVPTIVLNGSYSDANQNMSIINLRGLVCSLLKGDKPADCILQQPAASSSTVATVLLLALLLPASRLL